MGGNTLRSHFFIIHHPYITYCGWLVVLTILKNISQWEGLSHILWNFHGLSPRLSWFDTPVVQQLRHNIRIIWTWLACTRGVEACTQKTANELKQRNGCTCIGSNYECHINRQANNKVLPDATKNKSVSYTDNSGLGNMQIYTDATQCVGNTGVGCKDATGQGDTGRQKEHHDKGWSNEIAHIQTSQCKQ